MEDIARIGGQRFAVDYAQREPATRRHRHRVARRFDAKFWVEIRDLWPESAVTTGVLSTSFPRYQGDFAGCFVEDAVRALALAGETVEVMPVQYKVAKAKERTRDVYRFEVKAEPRKPVVQEVVEERGGDVRLIAEDDHRADGQDQDH